MQFTIRRSGAQAPWLDNDNDDWSRGTTHVERDTELDLLRRCLAMAGGDNGHHQGEEHVSPVGRYTDPARFDRELANIFQRRPVPYLHSSQLSETDSFRTLETPLGSVLVTRDAEGRARAFHNICRHRGTELVGESGGQATKFSCPYHAWTYSNRGELLAVPHGKSCFPSLQREQNGLLPLACEESLGFIWIGPAAAGAPLLPPCHQHNLGWLQLEALEVFAQDTRVWAANWKLIAEGGLETYHFRFAHKDTIAPYFLDNCAISDQFGEHTRTILPFANVTELADLDESRWSIRDHSHILYSLFPMSSLLVERDHVVWIHARPVAVDRTAITLTTLVPRSAGGRSEKERDYWHRNHEITVRTLDEDFVLGASIQRNLTSGSMENLRYGTTESPLHTFNQVVEACLAGPD